MRFKLILQLLTLIRKTIVALPQRMTLLSCRIWFCRGPQRRALLLREIRGLLSDFLFK
jgi:hypothetical protein